MREKANQIRYQENEYHTKKTYDNLKSENRLDLNVLLKRAKTEQKNDRRLNLLIYTGTISILLVFVFILSI